MFACFRLQQNLKNVTRTAKCICPHPLHFNIVVNHANHPWHAAKPQEEEAAAAAGGAAAAAKGKAGNKQSAKREKPEKKEKPPVQKKADLIRAKNLEVKQQKAKDVDSERAENLENLVSARPAIQSTDWSSANCWKGSRSVFFATYCNAARTREKPACIASACLSPASQVVHVAVCVWLLCCVCV